MKRGQETNQIWTQEAGTHDTLDRGLTLIYKLFLKNIYNSQSIPIECCIKQIHKGKKINNKPTP